MAGRISSLVLLLGLMAFSAHATMNRHEEVSQSVVSGVGESSATDDKVDSAEKNEDIADDIEADPSDDDDDDTTNAVAPAGPEKASEKAPVYAVATSTKSGVAKKNKNINHEELTPAGLAKKEDALEKSLSPHASEEARLKNDVSKASEELAANLHTQKELEQRVKYYADKTVSEQEIDASAKLVANETESVAMANMMGSMWKEMRMFDVPFYAEHVQKEIRQLKRDETKLEDKVSGAIGKKGAAEERWSKDGGGMQGIASNNGTLAKLEPIDGSLGKTPSISGMNFWGMSHGEKESFFAGWLAYIVAGFCLAFMYTKARSRNPKMFTPEVHRDKFHNPKDFAFHIFGCLGSPNICVMGFCCPCLRWADTMDQRGLLPYWKAFCAFFLLSVLHCYTWGISSLLVVALGVFYRQKLRASHEIESGSPMSIATDALLWLCCSPCAIIQEAREESITHSTGNV